MANHAESVLYASLTDVDALETLAREGFDLAIIPTEAGRPVVEWAIDYFFQSGRLKAPSPEAIRQQFGDLLADNDIDLGDGTETDDVTWAIDTLKSQYMTWRTQQFVKTFGTAMHEAPIGEKREVLAKSANELLDLSLAMSRRNERTTLGAGVDRALANYEAARLAGGGIQGLTLGLEAIDQTIGGIRPGEVCVLAAGPKTGKSFFCLRTAAHNVLRRGLRGALFTLENSVDMTVDRLICAECGIDPRRWQRQECDETEIQRVREWRALRLADVENNLLMEKCQPGEAGMKRMVRMAETFGADFIIIDQLTFVEHSDPGRKARHEIIRDLMHELKWEVSSRRKPIPALLAHQINREGVKAAQKTGFLEMHMLAEGSEVERTADFVLGLFQSADERATQMAKAQLMAARRTDTNAWSIWWNPSANNVGVIGEVDITS